MRKFMSKGSFLSLAGLQIMVHLKDLMLILSKH
jgi:hypothetical protein